MTKRIFCYAISLVGFLFVAGVGVVQAAVSLPDFSQTSDLPDFISSVYSFALTVVGIAVFIRILYAGFLWLTAAGNTAKAADARNKIKNAVIGAILLFAAYLILYVINPDLVSNAFRFTVPGSGRTSAPATAPKNTAGPTAGQLGVTGMAVAGGVGVRDGKAVSFYGLPTAKAQEGIYAFTVKVTDRNGDVCRETYNMEVLPGIAALEADSYAKYSVPGKHPLTSTGSARILGGVNVANAQEGGAETTGASFRYLKVESTSDSRISWREIEIYDENGQKIVPPNYVTTSSDWRCPNQPMFCNNDMVRDIPSNPPGVFAHGMYTELYDDNIYSGWSPTAGDATPWVKFDLGAVKNASKIRLFNSTQIGPPIQASHKLLISNDDVNYSLLHEFSGNIPWSTWLKYPVPTTSPLSSTQDLSDVEQTIQSGGCVINTMMLPDVIENVPYYAEIYAAGEAPFLYEIEDGSLPRGLSIVAALDMPVLTIKNLTAQRTPPTAFKVGETFRLELSNAKPNSALYFKWFKNGVPWFYPGKTPNSAGWTNYGTTDASGGWVNEAAFTASEIGVWQEYVMVDGKVSRVIEFQVLAPEVRVVVSAPAPGTGVPVYGWGGGGCTQTPYRCENKETGEISDLLTEDEVRACSSDASGGVRLVWPECVYPEHSRTQCAQYDFEARNCYDQTAELRGEGGYVDTSSLPHSTDGSPPTDVPAGSLYTTDQYSGDIRLGGNNLLVRCRYSDQVAAVSCGEMSSGEYCLPDGRNAGWNETWCAGKRDASGQIINPPAAAASPTPTPTPSPAGPTATPIPRGGETGGSRGR